MKNLDKIIKNDPLIKLVQKDNFVGWIYSINYENALVMTNDLWKYRTLGVPHNCFLIASAINPEKADAISNDDREVVLLRVVGSAKLPQDDDLVRTKIDLFQHQTSIDGLDKFGKKEYDDITMAKMQFGGLDCRVLGTFYTHDGQLWLGSDIESFASAARLNVYRPRGEALEVITNYVDPIRKGKAEEDAKALGLEGKIAPFKIGTVRYTSTMRLHRQDRSEEVAVSVQPTDFLARRTAVLGMTRTGKSNMIKQMVSVVKDVGEEGKLPIGQIIFDINGEYANANKQDKGALADIFPDDTVRYRIVPTPGFLPLQSNFYEQLMDGFSIVQDIIESKKSTSGDIQNFATLSFETPAEGDWGEIGKFNVRKACYWGLLSRAGFSAPNVKTKFKANKGVIEAVNAAAGEEMGDPNFGFTPKECEEWFKYLRESSRWGIKRPDDDPKKNKMGDTVRKWLNDDIRVMVNMIANKNESDNYILGWRLLDDAVKFHTPNRKAEVGDEIYKYLTEGKIVILDISVGKQSLRERITKKLATHIFNASMGYFVEGEQPPNIAIYIEEAHNLIGKNADPDEVWPRIAKEGAKYRISLIYATQEVSSMHANILANTENWFITHLNNKGEIRELAKFYDFEDFGQSLIKAQDVGFARVKTLSSPYVIPTQIDKFDPEARKKKKAA